MVCIWSVIFFLYIYGAAIATVFYLNEEMDSYL